MSAELSIALPANSSATTPSGTSVVAPESPDSGEFLTTLEAALAADIQDALPVVALCSASPATDESSADIAVATPAAAPLVSAALPMPIVVIPPESVVPPAMASLEPVPFAHPQDSNAWPAQSIAAQTSLATIEPDSEVTAAAQADSARRGEIENHMTPGSPKSTADAVFAAIASLGAQHERFTEPHAPVVRAHVGTPAWTEEIAGKLSWLIGRNVQHASLQLSPEHLGPLEIRISIHNDQTSVWFGAAHADTRAALEQALPRLRELLAGHGLNLSDAGVFREAPRQSKSFVSSTGQSVEREVAVAVVTPRGIIDAYA